jgi:hypothetical protein
MAAGGGQVGGVGVEVLSAAATVVLRAEQDEVAGPPGEGVAQVVKGAADEPIAGSGVSAMRAGAPPVVAATDAEIGLGQVLGARDAESGVGAIFAGSWHGVPPARRVLPGDTLGGGKVFIDSARFPCYRLRFPGFRSDLGRSGGVIFGGSQMSRKPLNSGLPAHIIHRLSGTVELGWEQQKPGVTAAGRGYGVSGCSRQVASP